MTYLYVRREKKVKACCAEHRKDTPCFQPQANMQIINFHIRKPDWNLRKGKKN